MGWMTLNGEEIEYKVLFIDGGEVRPEAYRFVTTDYTIVAIPRHIGRFHGAPSEFQSSGRYKEYLSNMESEWSCSGDDLRTPIYFKLHSRPHTASERNELRLSLEDQRAAEKHECATKIETSTTSIASAQPPTSPVVYKTNSIVWDYVNVEGTEWRKGGKHMIRRSDLAECRRQSPQESAFRQELELHPERRFYSIKHIDAVRRMLKKKKKGVRLPAEALYDITDWDPAWHPPGAPNWQHPGKNSVTNKPDQS